MKYPLSGKGNKPWVVASHALLEERTGLEYSKNAEFFPFLAIASDDRKMERVKHPPFCDRLKRGKMLSRYPGKRV